MSWTDPQWEAFCALLEEAWPGDFDDHARDAWRILLDLLDPAAAIEGMRRLLLEGHRFRPSVSQILEAARRDPSRPTFDEAMVLIYGPAGALRARAPHQVYIDDPDQVPAGERRTATRKRQDAELEAVNDRLDTMHPLIRAFVTRVGLTRLRRLALDDPDWGEKRRSDLHGTWTEFVTTWDGREVAALAHGGRTGLHRFDPLAVLNIAPPQLVLEAGDAGS